VPDLPGLRRLVNETSCVPRYPGYFERLTPAPALSAKWHAVAAGGPGEEQKKAAGSRRFFIRVNAFRPID